MFVAEELICIWIPLLQTMKTCVLLTSILSPIFTNLLHHTLLSISTSRLLTDFGTDAWVDHVNYRFCRMDACTCFWISFFFVRSEPLNQYPSGGSPPFARRDGAELGCDGVHKHDSCNFSNAASRLSRPAQLFFVRMLGSIMVVCMCVSISLEVNLTVNFLTDALLIFRFFCMVNKNSFACADSNVPFCNIFLNINLFYISSVLEYLKF